MKKREKRGGERQNISKRKRIKTRKIKPCYYKTLVINNKCHKENNNY